MSRIFAHRAGKFRKLLVARDPANLTREFHKVDRRGRILVDTGRNRSKDFLRLESSVVLETCENEYRICEGLEGEDRCPNKV
jgi:hypothetical protein